MNMTKFNVGKFNVKSSAIGSVNGSSDMAIDTSVSSILIDKYIEKTQSNISINTVATAHVNLVGITGNADLELISKALAANLVYGEDLGGDMILDAYAVGSLLGEDYVEIRGLRLEPGEEVEIDMCNLTVTVNGENAMHLMSADGDFFDFLIGENEIEIEAIGANGVQIDTYWKNRWL